jgi:hypothetical protein
MRSSVYGADLGGTNWCSELQLYETTFANESLDGQPAAKLDHDGDAVGRRSANVF